MKPVLLYLGPQSAVTALEAAREHFDILAIPRDAALLARELPAATAFLIADTEPYLSDALIASAPHLRAVGTATTGATHIDGVALEARGIPLITLKGRTDVLGQLTPAAELSWALAMACARRLPAAFAHVRDGGWNRNDFPGVMLNGKTLGVIGYGRIGQWMTRYGAAFGLRCLAYDPVRQDWPGGAERVHVLDDLLSQSDVISLHVNFSEDLRRFISRDRFAAMKPGCIFINTSRGQLIDEPALLDALQSGRVAAAALDVLTTEPPAQDDPLLLYARTHDDLIITPHMGGNSPDAVKVVVRFVAQEIQRVLQG